MKKNNIRTQLIFFLLIHSFLCIANPFPLEFCIPEVKIVSTIPIKDRDFAFIVAGKRDTYIYDQESEYYKDYQRSYFAVTCKKAGWDCMRHYEILANGCIPYFIDLEKCDPNTMLFLPKQLILEAMHLEGVSYMKINHSKFNKKRYYEILNELLDYTKKYLTPRSMANYLLKTLGYSGTGKILYLSKNLELDYSFVLVGLRENLQDKVVDFPKVPHWYKSYVGDTKQFYGKGFSYTKILDDIPIDRENIEQRIKNKEFEYIIYGSFHRGLLFHDLVIKTYEPNKIVYIDIEDGHFCPNAKTVPNLFLREFDAVNTTWLGALAHFSEERQYEDYFRISNG